MKKIMLRRKEVEAICGISRATLYRWCSENRFPQSYRLGPRAVAWSAAEIENWLATRPRARSESPAA